MKILFIIPPVTEKIWSNHYHEIYLGLAYLARIAYNLNYKVRVMDCDAKFIPLSTMKHRIKVENPDFIGVTALYGSLNNTMKIIKICKKYSNATLIMGGLPATFIPNYIFKESSVDIIVRGEAEEPFKELLQKKQLKNILGISYRKGEKIFHNNNRQHVEDLDSFGLPMRKFFPLRKYKIRFKLHNSTTIETARGCPYGCDFCTQQPKEGSILRFRSPDMVIRELKEISRKFKFIKRIMIVDNDFLVNQVHSSTILKLIIQYRLNKRFHFMIATRVDNLIRGGKGLLELLKKSNVKTIFFGIESVSENYKGKIGKIKDEKLTYSLFKTLEKVDIDALPSYVIGYPHENRKDINQTLDFAKKLNTKLFSFNILTPYPGTPFYNQCKNEKCFQNFAYNKLDNAHKVFVHKLDLEKELLRLHRTYLFRKEYIRKINIFQIHKRANYGRLAMFMYYIVYMEIASKIRSLTRIIKKPFSKQTFET